MQDCSRQGGAREGREDGGLDTEGLEVARARAHPTARATSTVSLVGRPTVLMQQSSRGVPKPRQTSIGTTAASEICFESGPIIVLKDCDAQALVPYKAGDLKRAVMQAGRASAKSANPCR